MTQTARTIDHAIVDILIIKDGKYLLIEETKPGREGLFNLPGGHVEAHETLFEAAIREAKEETGYDVELTGFIGVYQGIFNHINVAGPVFSAKIIGGESAPSLEHPSQRWVAREELNQLAADGKLFTKYPPIAVDHYHHRGMYPLDLVACCDYTE